MSIKLTPKQKEIVERIKKDGSVKITYDREVPIRTVKSLIKLKICDYNSSFDKVILTDLGKQLLN